MNKISNSSTGILSQALPFPDRREFLKALGVAALAGSLPRASWAQNRSDVLVIGAGLSGLAAALLLEESGANVRVIEGRNRVGGRVESVRALPGAPESGGTGFSPGYARLVGAARRYGVELIDVLPTLKYYGVREIFLGGQHVPAAEWPTHPENPFPAQSRDTPPWRYLQGLIAANNPLKTAEAWQAPENAHLDIPLYDWLRQQGVSDASIRIAYNLEPRHGNSAWDVSALMMLFSASFVDVQRKLAKPGESPIMTARGGNQSIPEAMAAALAHEVELEREVVAIQDSGDQVAVSCADGHVYRADHVVCSVPCPVLRNITISPALPPEQARAVNTLESMVVNMVHMAYKEPFWEEDGLSPNMFSDGLVSNLVGEHKGTDPREVTSLTAWIRGHKAAYLDQIPEAEARRLVLEDIAERRPAARGKLEIVEYKSWYRDRFSAGDWSYWQPGQVSGLGPYVARPHGRLHFCGEHTAVSNRGMEGAMESGERVAIEILEQL
jgi:monoamine oxidase